MKILVIGNGHSLLDIQKPKERARSGGETKLVENLKRWKRSASDVDIRILCPEITKDIFTYAGVEARFLTLPKSCNSSRLGLMATFFKRILGSLRLNIPKDFDIVYSPSDFLFDLIPSIWVKRKNLHSKLVVCLYLLAPPPWKGYEKIFDSGLIFPKANSIIYYFSQKLSILLMKYYADRIQVFNSFDKEYLINKNIQAEKIKVVNGGVDVEYISGIIGDKDKKYDATFLGRLQPQKGFLDLIDIWSKICQKKPEAKLALIGGGTKRAYEKLALRIKREALENNITIFGFLKGEEIFKVLKSGKIFLCPSRYESWGMIVAEAMACGLPVIAYDLPVFRELFPKGMISVPVGDTEEFATRIIEILNDEELRKKIGEEASETSVQYDWKRIAEEELKDLKTLGGEKKE